MASHACWNHWMCWFLGCIFLLLIITWSKKKSLMHVSCMIWHRYTIILMLYILRTCIFRFISWIFEDDLMVKPIKKHLELETTYWSINMEYGDNVIYMSRVSMQTSFILLTKWEHFVTCHSKRFVNDHSHVTNGKNRKKNITFWLV